MKLFNESGSQRAKICIDLRVRGHLGADRYHGELAWACHTGCPNCRIDDCDGVRFCQWRLLQRHGPRRGRSGDGQALLPSRRPIFTCTVATDAAGDTFVFESVAGGELNGNQIVGIQSFSGTSYRLTDEAVIEFSSDDPDVMPLIPNGTQVDYTILSFKQT